MLAAALVLAAAGVAAAFLVDGRAPEAPRGAGAPLPVAVSASAPPSPPAPLPPAPATTGGVAGAVTVEKRDVEVTIVATGDLALGSAEERPPAGAAGLLAGVRLQLDADVVLGNLETTLATGGSSQCRRRSRACYAFRAPPVYARGLERTGFTILNLANNHAFDYGAAGQAETVAALRDAGLRHTGRPGQIAYQRVGPARVAVIGFAPYPWAQTLLDLREARRLVREAARRTDLVVVTMHAGAEGLDRAHVRPGPETFLGERRGDPVAFAHAVIEAGADLVAGHGPHVLRGMEWYRGRLIAYSLGNFASYRNFDLTGKLAVSGILHVTLRADGSWVDGWLVPIRLVGGGAPILDRKREALRLVRSLSRQDFGRRALRVSPEGLLRPPGRD